ncbi:MAG: hypothetical protein M3Z18_11450 [Gemmatimonadota bacterium]|nr:hypothetical protein [Gemmatimonadota bacterium]
MIRSGQSVTVLALMIVAVGAGAQTVPPVRPLGPVIRVSAANLLESVSSVRPLPGGRLIISDVAHRRVVLLDSTLTKSRTIVDSSSASGGMFGLQLAGIIPYKGDSTLFVDPQSLSVLVIDGSGKIARVMAVPRSQDAPYLVGGPLGTPRFDRLGRLIYRGYARRLAPPPVSTGTTTFSLPLQPDSAPVVRTNLETRKQDTLGFVKVSRVDIKVSRRDDGGLAIATTLNPMQVLDDWAVFADGTLALVRGRDYHVDWVAPDGTRSSTPNVPFDWKRLTEEERGAFLDSARAAINKRIEAAREATGGSATRSQPPAISLVPVGELPDYRPAFEPGAARVDSEDRLWIRTSKVINNGAVYDVLSRAGELIDRVVVPQFRTIIGFGEGGIVYMGVLDGAGARLEEARSR